LLNAPHRAATAVYRPGVAPADLQLILARCAPAVWHALRGQRLFITGGTGFVGCWLLEALLWADQELGLDMTLTLLTRDPAGFLAKAPHLAGHVAVTLLQGEVGDLSMVHGRYDSIIHAATDVARPGQDPGALYHDIVRGAEQTLALARRCQAQRFLLTSSGAVYGEQPPHLTHLPDDDAGLPSASAASAYGRGKRAAEALLQLHAGQDGLVATSARIFALLGPYLPLDAHFAVGNFIADLLAGRAIAVRGDGSACRSYLYAADMAVWLLTILTLGGSGQSYNVGSEHGLSIAELAHQVGALAPHGTTVTIAQAATPGAPAARYVPHTGKARHALGLAEFTDLQTALRNTITWSVQRTTENYHA
jgi:nucleoside-diphosphate-sugar epimerase